MFWSTWTLIQPVRLLIGLAKRLQQQCFLFMSRLEPTPGSYWRYIWTFWRRLIYVANPSLWKRLGCCCIFIIWCFVNVNRLTQMMLLGSKWSEIWRYGYQICVILKEEFFLLFKCVHSICFAFYFFCSLLFLCFLSNYYFIIKNLS